ncbi:MAG: phosphoribosylformylglycinamidine synthase subunit PurQ [Paenibacillaceae bacterium]|nr:phosphoribosylformylglycinamidine synthase subunit PurQ [Paenibacillaceae bacterium]
MTRKRAAVVSFPGSNCDEDCVRALRTAMDADRVWHTARSLDAYDAIVLPGGFSYGDYLRAGAIARFSPVIEAVHAAAERGVPIIGICNGFQILLECGLLPGTMRKNVSRKFVCAPTTLVVARTDTVFTKAYDRLERIRIPIAHGEGNYYCDEETLRRIQHQIVFRYEDNPNGSVDNIAGIVNAAGNVLGMMPHPERAVDRWLGSTDGVRLMVALAAV